MKKKLSKNVQGTEKGGLRESRGNRRRQFGLIIDYSPATEISNRNGEKKQEKIQQRAKRVLNPSQPTRKKRQYRKQTV